MDARHGRTADGQMGWTAGQRMDEWDGRTTYGWTERIVNVGMHGQTD